MDSFLFDLLQGAGIAAAIGIRPFLPVLLVGALASANLGIDFGGTDFAFLEQAPALAIVLVLLALATFAVRSAGPDAPERQPFVGIFAALAVILGALQGAASLADHDHPILAGVLVGAACAALGFVAVRNLLMRTRRRLDAEAAGTLPIYAEGAALAAAGASVLFPPLAILVIAGLVALLVGGRRRSGEKYAGLRILR
jgi:Na+-translocating ferredoxin:NAD+ oxidoreductase RnfA subunit